MRYEDHTHPLWRCVQGLLELIYLYPLIVLLSVYVLNVNPVFAFFLFLIGLEAAILISTVLKRKIMAGFISLITGIVISGTGMFLWQQGQSTNMLILLLTAAVGGGGGFRGFVLSKKAGAFFLAERLQYTGLFLLLALSLIAMKVSSLENHITSMYLAGVIGLLIYIWNRHLREMQHATLDPKGKRPLIKSFTQLNRTRIILFLIIVVILGAFNSLSEMFNYLWNGFTSWFRSLFNQEPSKEVPESISPFPTEEDRKFMPARDGNLSEPSPVWDWVLNAIVMIVVLIFAIFICYKLWRLLKKVSVYLQTRNKASTEPALPEKIAYIDITETIENRPKRDIFRLLRKQRVPVEPEQRIRYYYKSVVEQAGKEAGPLPSSITPNELEQWLNEHEEVQHKHFPYRGELIHQLITLYNKVRYGEQKVSPEEIQPLDQAHK